MATIKTVLDLDTSKFTSKASVVGESLVSGVEYAKHKIRKLDLGRSITNLFGFGAIVEGFRLSMERAKEARAEAEKLGRAVDVNVAAVGRYADSWTQIKNSIADVGIFAIGTLNRLGENAATALMRPARRRVLDISEKASANADKLSSPEALEAAKRRGEEKRRVDEENMRALAAVMNRGMDMSEQGRRKELTDEQKLVKLQQDKLFYQKQYADGSLKAIERANALVKVGETDKAIEETKSKIVAARVKEYEDWSAENEKRQKAEVDAINNATKAREKYNEATRKLSDARHDALASSLGDIAGGKTGIASDQVRARNIQNDEAMARQLFNSGNSVTQWDSKLGRNVSRDAAFFQNRAEQMRRGFGKLTTGDQDPFGGAYKDVKEAAKELKDAAKELRDLGLPEDTNN